MQRQPASQTVPEKTSKAKDRVKVMRKVQLEQHQLIAQKLSMTETEHHSHHIT